MDKKEDQNKKLREYRARTGNAATKKYEKTKKGFLVRAYRNMKSRIDGVQWRKAHLYTGKELLPKEEFYKWALASKDFHALFDAYESAGYKRMDSPSVDRLDSSLGYLVENMQWVTTRENSYRGVLSKYSKER